MLMDDVGFIINDNGSSEKLAVENKPKAVR